MVSNRRIDVYSHAESDRLRFTLIAKLCCDALESMMIRVFVSHRFSEDPTANQFAVATISRGLALDGVLPIAPQIYLPQFIREADERDLALKLCLHLVRLVDVMKVHGRVSDGMRLEIAEARRLGIPVVAGDAVAEMALTGEPPR